MVKAAASLWQNQDRETVRTVLVITVCWSAFLVLWAFIYVVRQSTRTASGRDNAVIFVINVLYISCLLVSLLYYSASLFVPAENPNCSALKCFSHLAVLLTMATNVLSSLHCYLTSRGDWITSRLTSHPRLTRALVLGLYFLIAAGIPVLNVSLFIDVEQQTFVDRPRTVCWISPDNIVWLVLPIILYLSGGIAISVLTRINYRSILPPVRCNVYSHTVLNALFCVLMLAVQLDISYQSMTTAFLLLCLFLAHNILLFMHITDNIHEVFPCSAMHLATHGNDRAVRQHSSLQPFPPQHSSRTNEPTPTHHHHHRGHTPAQQPIENFTTDVNSPTPAVNAPVPHPPSGGSSGMEPTQSVTQHRHQQREGVLDNTVTVHPAKSLSVEDVPGALTESGLTLRQ